MAEPVFFFFFFFFSGACVCEALEFYGLSPCHFSGGSKGLQSFPDPPVRCVDV